MADIAYSTVYDYIRTWLGDWGTDGVYDYSNNILDASITQVLLFDSVSGYSKVSGVTEITPDITADNDKTKELSLKAAKMILAPEPTFSYRTVVLSIDRSGDTTKEDLLTAIEDALQKLAAGGNVPITSDGSVDQYLTMADRVEEIIDANA